MFRTGIAASVLWALFIILLQIWEQAHGERGWRDPGEALASVFLPILFLWACLTLYRWARK